MSDDILKKLAETASNPAAVGADAVRTTFAEHFGAMPVEAQCAIMAVLSGDFLLTNLCGVVEKSLNQKGVTASAVSEIVYSGVIVELAVQLAKEASCTAIDKALADGFKRAAEPRT